MCAAKQATSSAAAAMMNDFVMLMICMCAFLRYVECVLKLPALGLLITDWQCALQVVRLLE